MSHAVSARADAAAAGTAGQAGRGRADASTHADASAEASPGAVATYFADSRNAIYSLLLALPFVLVYEFGIYANQYRMLNGGDWLIRSLMLILSPEHVPFASVGVLFAVFLAYQFIRNDSLKVKSGVLFGLTVESIFYAILLIPLAAWSVALLQQLAAPTASILAYAPENTPAAYIAQAGQLSAAVHSPEMPSWWNKVVLYCGAGVYEELVFRVLMLWTLFGIGVLLKFPKWVNVIQAAVGSALIFSLFHYFPPGPYPFQWATFTYRALAGLYFTTIVYSRNFGVAVASHALYDILVG